MTTCKPKLNGIIKTWLTAISIFIVVSGIVFSMGVSWASVGRIEDKVNGVSQDVDAQDIRIRSVEDAVIRTDERLENIEDGIDEIKVELRNE